MQIDYTAQANQQNESNISAHAVTESEQPSTSTNAAEKIVPVQEGKLYFSYRMLAVLLYFPCITLLKMYFYIPLCCNYIAVSG